MTHEVVLKGTLKYISGISLHPGGDRLALSGTMIEGVGVWSLQSGKRVALFARPEGISVSSQNGAKFGPDGRTIGYRAVYGVLHVCDYPAGTERFALRPPGIGEFSSWRFSPDGQRIVTGDDWGGVQFWDAADGHLLNAHSRHRDTATSQPLTEPRRHEGSTSVDVVEFSPDGRFLLTDVGPDSPHLIWSMSPDGGGVATPAWLLRLATACASKRLTDDGEMIAADEEVAKIDEVRREIAALPADAPFVEWARWFLADRPRFHDHPRRGQGAGRAGPAFGDEGARK